MAGIGTYKPIKLVRYTTTIDSNGNNIESVDVIYKMWAEVTSGGGSRTLEKERTSMSDQKTFKFSFKGYNLDPDFKIQYFGQVYAISSIERINEQRFNWRVTAYSIFEIPSISISGGSGGGGSEIPNLTYSNGTATTVSGTYQRFIITGNYGNYLQFVSYVPFKIAFPNGDILSFPACNLSASFDDFAFTGEGNLDIYYESTPNQLIFIWYGFTVTMPNNIPNEVNLITLSAGVYDSFNLPSSLSVLNISFNYLTDEAVNDIFTQLIDSNITSGTLKISHQKNRTLNLSSYSGYSTLVSRNWMIS